MSYLSMVPNSQLGSLLKGMIISWKHMWQDREVDLCACGYSGKTDKIKMIPMLPPPKDLAQVFYGFTYYLQSRRNVFNRNSDEIVTLNVQYFFYVWMCVRCMCVCMYYTWKYCSKRPWGKMPYSFGPKVRSARMANITLSNTRESTPCVTERQTERQFDYIFALVYTSRQTIMIEEWLQKWYFPP